MKAIITKKEDKYIISDFSNPSNIIVTDSLDITEEVLQEIETQRKQREKDANCSFKAKNKVEEFFNKYRELFCY